MEKKIRNYVDNIFKSYENNTHAADVKEEIISNLLERVNDLIGEDLNRNEAYDKAIEMLGSDEDLISTFDLKRVGEYSINYSAALIILSLSVIGYLVLGFVFTLWHPGWLIFPVGIMVLSTIENKFGVVWLLALSIYILFGTLEGGWWAGLLIFGFAASLSAAKDELIAGVWLLIISGYLVIGFGFGLWHPGWLLFIAGFAITSMVVEKSIIAFSWLSAITAYLYVGLVHDLWHPTWVLFLIAAAITVYLETDRNRIEEVNDNE